MTAGRRAVYLSCLLLHFVLVLAVSCRDTFSILSQGGNLTPASFSRFWHNAEVTAAAAAGEKLRISNPVRQALAAYMHSAGIEAGYAFFAPNVPNSYKLVFEIHYPEGRIEYALPEIHGTATGFRLVSLFDNIGRTNYAPLRELFLKMLAYSVWREHPRGEMVRAVFGFVNLPSVTTYKQGAKESYVFLYAYDFKFPSQTPEPPVP
jgi:hypothetical protein